MSDVTQWAERIDNCSSFRPFVSEQFAGAFLYDRRWNGCRRSVPVALLATIALPTFPETEAGEEAAEIFARRQAAFEKAFTRGDHVPAWFTVTIAADLSLTMDPRALPLLAAARELEVERIPVTTRYS